MIINFDVKDKKRFEDNVKQLLQLQDSKIKIRVEQRVHYNKVKKKNGTFTIGRTANTTTEDLARYHEFGLGNNPKRSFIVLPVQKFFKRDLLEALNKYKRVDAILRNTAKKVYERIQEAFETNGWGEWAMLTDKYKKQSGRQDPPGLTDTGQLRKAVYVVYENKSGNGGQIGLEKKSRGK